MARKVITGGGAFTSKNISDINSNFVDTYAGTFTSPTLTSPVIQTGLTASGSASNDFSASTGTFKTSTGANTLGAATTINGTLTISDATTPSVTTSAGETNTGNVTINGKTSGKLVLTTADATAQTVTVTTAAQTSGAGTLTIPDLAGASKTVTFKESPTLTTPVIGVATGTSLAVTGALSSSSPSAGVGYATGAGNVIAQSGSRTTGVTINALCGTITLVSAAGSATPASFTVTNSSVAISDVIIVNTRTATDLYEIFVTTVAAGSFKITSFTTGGTTTETPIFNFAVIKGVAA